MRTSLLVLALLAAEAPARGQSTIYGLDLFHDHLYTTDTADFVGHYVEVDANSHRIRALDFDASATTLWGIRNDSREYGTLDLTDGSFTALGTITGPTGGVTGLSSAVDGTTWYLSEWDNTSVTSFLYVGDVTTGNFTQVGPMGFEIVIDISIDSRGNLYAHTISDDALYRVDTATGASTYIGPTGYMATFAQGMDFDWSDDTLYATIFVMGGTSLFATMDLSTGAAHEVQDTTVLGGELEMAVKRPVPVPVGTAYCFGDDTGSVCACGNSGAAGEGCANSTGSGARLDAQGSASAAADDLLFSADGLLPAQPALLFAGLLATNDGDGIPFGDGLRCAGGGVVRLGVKSPDAAGHASWGPGLSALGGWSNGDTRRFQGWYRDPTGSPCGFVFNLTHGYEITFTP